MSDPIKVGDKVTWTHASFRGCLELSAWEGVVVEVHEHSVDVKRKGKFYRMNTLRLRRHGERTELTDIALGMVTPKGGG